MPQAVNTV